MHLLNSLWWWLVRFGFRLLYNELAFTYDLVSQVVSLGAWRCWQRAALRYLPEAASGAVLEIAHGTGNFQLDLQNHGYHTVSMDLSPAMGRIARRKILRQRGRMVLLRANAQKLPFGDEQFAAVVSTFPTDFIFAETTLREIHRVLVPGGSMVVVLSGVFEGSGVLRSFLEWLYRVTGQRGNDTPENVFEEVVGIFRGQGFEVSDAQESCPRSRAIVFICRKKV